MQTFGVTCGSSLYYNKAKKSPLNFSAKFGWDDAPSFNGTENLKRKNKQFNLNANFACVDRSTD